ncbi:UNVERIFIED_CONTAM: hypothetical protein Slati_4077400 [Sesamum latifolium]|uniref:Uncharacterized protein n=1 Tax=Sesamum latifolium TaxID=2727402 RepID=A0AAW2T6W6_9LAMI
MLKVLSEYPEAKMTNEQQIASLGETFQELVKRLDDGTSQSTYLSFTLFSLDAIVEVILGYPIEAYLSVISLRFAALHSFDEGPPFTLQRLCEILLAARSIYPKLSKLSLALEKNLLVTSTLTISSDPSPLGTEQNSNGSYEGSGSARPPTNSVENGIEPPLRDKDEIMAEVQEAEAGEDMTIDMETIEDIVRSSEANPTPNVDHSNS